MGPTVYFTAGYHSLDGTLSPGKGGDWSESAAYSSLVTGNLLRSLFAERLLWVLSFAKMSTGMNEFSSCLATNPSQTNKPSGLMAALHSSLGSAGSPQATVVFQGTLQLSLWDSSVNNGLSHASRERQGKCGINYVSVVLCCHNILIILWFL